MPRQGLTHEEIVEAFETMFSDGYSLHTILMLAQQAWKKWKEETND